MIVGGVDSVVKEKLSSDSIIASTGADVRGVAGSVSCWSSACPCSFPLSSPLLAARTSFTTVLMDVASCSDALVSDIEGSE